MTALRPIRDLAVQTLSGLLACLGILTALATGSLRADTLLFDSHELMELTIPLNFKALCRPREDSDCAYTPTLLEYRDSEGRMQSMDIEIITRGGWRSLTRNCSAPLLFIRFDEETSAGTPFEGQSVLPLTTHCGQGLTLEATRFRQRRSSWEQYLLREYLAHRLYNPLTGVSLRSRLVRMTYPNPDKPSRRIVHYAFFTEHFESVAARNGLELLDRKSFEAGALDASAAARLALFQYMIGNTDWSIVRERNVILLKDSAGRLQPLPYDFDMSGLVNAHYAGPAPTLPIETVRDRYYLGFCHPDTDWNALFAVFLQQEPAMRDMVTQIPELDKKSLKSVNGFLGEFFETIRSEDLRRQDIVDQCRPWPPSPIDHTTPSEMR